MGRPPRRPTRDPWPVLVGILLFCGLGCQRSPLGDGLPAKLNCYSCHGSKKNSAPPLAVNGATSTSDIGVGAHQAHVNEGLIAGLIVCEECHGEMPTVMDGDAHPDPLSGGTVIEFGPLAQSGGATPAWNRTTETCTNAYCHGGSLPGSFTPAPPRWTKVDGSQVKCDSCHAMTHAGLGASHPLHSAYRCDTCHRNVVSADLKTILDPYLHVDGLVDVIPPSGTWDPVTRTCAGTTAPCHGSNPW